MAWVQYGANRRYDPDSGEVQYDLSKGQGDKENWQTVAGLGKFDPNQTRDWSQGPVQSQELNGGKKMLVNDPGRYGGWSLPDLNTQRQIYYAQQMAQQQTPSTQTQSTQTPAATQSYYGASPQISEGTAGMIGGAPSYLGSQPQTRALGYNPYSPPVTGNSMIASPGISAMSDLAVRPPSIQPLGQTNLGQANQQGGSSLIYG